MSSNKLKEQLKFIYFVAFSEYMNFKSKIIVDGSNYECGFQDFSDIYVLRCTKNPTCLLDFKHFFKKNKIK